MSFDGLATHEAHFTADRKDVNSYADIEIIGYGATKNEAIKNLNLALDDIAAQISIARSAI